MRREYDHLKLTNWQIAALEKLVQNELSRTADESRGIGNQSNQKTLLLMDTSLIGISC
jgi:hypothetical protein